MPARPFLAVPHRSRRKNGRVYFKLVANGAHEITLVAYARYPTQTDMDVPFGVQLMRIRGESNGQISYTRTLTDIDDVLKRAVGVDSSGVIPIR